MMLHTYMYVVASKQYVYIYTLQTQVHLENFRKDTYNTCITFNLTFTWYVMSFNKKNDLKNELSKNHDIVVNFVLYLMFLVISTLRSLEWSCAFFFM